MRRDCNRVVMETSGVIKFNSADFEHVTSCIYLIAVRFLMVFGN